VRAPPVVRCRVGSAPPAALVGLAANLPDVTVHGFVDDVRPYMDAAALYICPIRDGGGTKLKLLDAFAMRKCVVAHPIACEGIDAVPGRHVVHAESAAQFVRAIVHLLGRPEERSALGVAARQLVVERYSFAQIWHQLAEVFGALAAKGQS